jgi:hypothetical protein
MTKTDDADQGESLVAQLLAKKAKESEQKQKESEKRKVQKKKEQDIAMGVHLGQEADSDDDDDACEVADTLGNIFARRTIEEMLGASITDIKPNNGGRAALVTNSVKKGNVRIIRQDSDTEKKDEEGEKEQFASLGKFTVGKGFGYLRLPVGTTKFDCTLTRNVQFFIMGTEEVVRGK